MDEKEKDSKPPRVKSRTNLVGLGEEAFIKSQLESPNYKKSYSCLCSPTTHAGSFRCRLHRQTASTSGGMRRGSSVGSNLSDLANKFDPHHAALSSLSREA